MKPVFFTTLLLLTGCGRDDRAVSVVQDAQTQQAKIEQALPLETASSDTDTAMAELLNQIATLPPWPTDRHYTSQEWGQFVRVAKIAQHADRDILRKALELHPRGLPFQARLDATSRIIILLRVMFAPSDALKVEMESHPPWLQPLKPYGWDGFWVDGGSTDPFAPVAVRDSQLVLTDLRPVIRGWRGSMYEPGREYDRFSSYCQFRDLDMLRFD